MNGLKTMNDEYISKHAALTCVCQDCSVKSDCYDPCIDYIRIKDISAANVKPVIMCEKCAFYEMAAYENGTKKICRLFNRQMQNDDFCSYAILNEGAQK